MNKIEVYTDGACSGNPGKGGYAFVILHNEKEILKLKLSEEDQAKFDHSSDIMKENIKNEIDPMLKQ